MTTMLDYLKKLNKGDQVSLLLAGILVDGTFEELLDDCVVITEAKSPSIKKKRFTMKVPVDRIYAWVEKEKKEKKDKKKKKSE